MINERINQLRELMIAQGIDIYLIPTNDYHNSEYVADHFQHRIYMSGFTGSAGTMLVTQSEALLWTDGRYFLQAQKQLADSEIILMKQGVKGVVSVYEYLEQHPNCVVGFNGRQLPLFERNKIKNKIIAKYDLVDAIWPDRPKISNNKFYDYKLKYCGESRRSKLSRIREQMQEYNHYIIGKLEDIAWLFNLRNSDIEATPVGYSYASIDHEKATLYVQNGSIDDKLRATLLKDNIIVKDYYAIYNDVRNYFGKILLDSQSINYTLAMNINYSCKIIDKPNLTSAMKAIKNPTEIAATKNAHIKDGVAMTKFIYWLMHTIGKEKLNELSIAEKLLEFRKEQAEFKEVSFTTISAYQENAAMLHYHPTKNSYKEVEAKGLLLVDSGGQYLDGTTDVTRTFVLGPVTKEQKRDFTIALKAMLRLQDTSFIEGTTGINLDILARGIVYSHGMDYRCGTGHGVGHFLGVHEGPNSIRTKEMYREPSTILPGMITTDEPGIYVDGKYGIRHENELLCVPSHSNEYGNFLRFEPITYVPFDYNGIDMDVISNIELEQLAKYQKMVYEKISPFLTEKERIWLRSYCHLDK